MGRKGTSRDDKVRENIHINMRISLDIEFDENGTGNKKNLSLSSIVDDVCADDSLLIYMPLHRGGYYPLPRDKTFMVHFSVDAKMYALPVRFTERVIREDMVFARIWRVGAIKQGQRRECYRLPCSMPVVVERLDEKGSTPAVVGQTVDLSDGGMLFASNENYRISEELTLMFDAGGIETVTGIVLRATLSEYGKFRFRIAVQFQIEDKTQKQRLYKYIMHKQREERQRLTHQRKGRTG